MAKCSSLLGEKMGRVGRESKEEETVASEAALPILSHSSQKRIKAPTGGAPSVGGGGKGQLSSTCNHPPPRYRLT